MEKKVFRENYMDTLTSPDQFDRYIKIMNPKIWVILAAMIIVLLNVLAWTFSQNQVIRISTVGIAKDGEIVCWLKENDKAAFDNLKDDVNLYVYDTQDTFSDFVSISKEPIEYTDDDNRYAAHLGDVYYGEWVYEVKFKADLPDGVYSAIIRNRQSER